MPGMLRLLHTADVHLGARHADLGDQAAAQRERQFAAFRATVDLALAEQVDVLLIAGDLFDSNTQPRRSVERVAAELKRLADAAIRVVIIPGTHDVYDRASVYRAYDLAAIAGLAPDSDRLVVLTPDRPDVVFGILDLAVHGFVFATKRAPRSPLAGFSAAADDRARWHVGLIHGSLAIPGKTDADEVVFTAAEIAASHLDYLALGPLAFDAAGPGGRHHVGLQRRAGAGRRRPGSRRQRPARDARGAHGGAPRGGGGAPRRADAASTGSTSTRRRSPASPPSWSGSPASPIPTSSSTSGSSASGPTTSMSWPTRSSASSPTASSGSASAMPSAAALPDGPLPPPDTIAGALVRDLRGVHRGGRGGGRLDESLELREALRLARLLLDGHEVAL